MAQLVRHPTLDLGSGHYLTVCGIEFYHTVNAELAWGTLPLSVSKYINLKKKKQSKGGTYSVRSGRILNVKLPSSSGTLSLPLMCGNMKEYCKPGKFTQPSVSRVFIGTSSCRH